VTADASLLRWLESPSGQHGIRFLQPGGQWQLYPYAELASLALSAAALLADRGVRRGDVVSVVTQTGPEFVAGFFGALACGAAPSPVAPPLITQQPGAYHRHLAHILTAARPRAVLTTPDLAPRVGLAMPDGLACEVLAVTAPQLAAVPPAAARAAPETALLQFTSGSSGAPKGVTISARALESNIGAIMKWLKMTPDDPTASWLPVHHDMGLIGCLLTPVVNGSDLWAMRPVDFVQSPATWLECFGMAGARLTAVPNFGLGYVARRVAPGALAGMDFAQWRTVIIGAERVDPGVLQRFAELLAPHGFSASAFQPAYGLAEATLAVTGVPLGEPPRIAVVDRRSLILGDRVAVADGSTAAQRWATQFVGCGRPLGAATVRVTGPGGEELADGRFGEIVVEGPSVASGYLRGAGQPLVTNIDGNVLRTGDAGFMLDGELFVVGRLGDSIKRRAHTVFAEDLESLLLDIPEMRRARPVVLLGNHEGTDVAVVVAECGPGPWIDAVTRLVRLHTEGIRVTVCTGRRGLIQRTSSGKPRRRLMWHSFVTGRLQPSQTASPAAIEAP
jgi:acyl-CoA synthetase (AMP-forming)/AMP-acid ligase II